MFVLIILKGRDIFSYLCYWIEFIELYFFRHVVQHVDKIKNAHVQYKHNLIKREIAECLKNEDTGKRMYKIKMKWEWRQ